MKTPKYAFAILAVLFLPMGMAAQKPSLTIQVDHPTVKVSPMLYGLMTEEINYSYDGGIYGELVRDRTVHGGFGGLTHWTTVSRGNSMAAVSVDESTGPSTAIPRSLKVSVTSATKSAPAGVQNDGYWGFPVRPNTTYNGSFYAKADTAGVPVTVSLVNDQTGATAATATVTGLTGDWKQYSFTLKTAAVPVTSNNHLILTVAATGNCVARSGLALPADLSRPREWQPHRHYGKAGRHESEVPATARRKLS